MKRSILKSLFGILAAGCVSTGAFASVETFDSALAAQAHGFSLSSNIVFHDPGRPYLEYYDQNHSITYAGAFTFNSLDFNIDPWLGYLDNNGVNALHMQLLNSSHNVLLDTILAIPTDRSWMTYGNNVENVSEILFFATGSVSGNLVRGFWPSIDNLVYNEQGQDVPEPSVLALLGLGLAGLAMKRRRQN